MAGKRFARILLLRATEQISAEKTISKKKVIKLSPHYVYRMI